MHRDGKPGSPPRGRRCGRSRSSQGNTLCASLPKLRAAIEPWPLSHRMSSKRIVFSPLVWARLATTTIRPRDPSMGSTSMPPSTTWPSRLVPSWLSNPSTASFRLGTCEMAALPISASIETRALPSPLARRADPPEERRNAADACPAQGAKPEGVGAGILARDAERQFAQLRPGEGGDNSYLKFRGAPPPLPRGRPGTRRGQGASPAGPVGGRCSSRRRSARGRRSASPMPFHALGGIVSVIRQ